MSLKVVQSSLVRHVKSLGASIANPILQNEVIKWIEKIGPLKDSTVILFDSHTDDMAKKLIEKYTKSVFIGEGSQVNADKQKVSFGL